MASSNNEPKIPGLLQDLRAQQLLKQSYSDKLKTTTEIPKKWILVRKIQRVDKEITTLTQQIEQLESKQKQSFRWSRPKLNRNFSEELATGTKLSGNNRLLSLNTRTRIMDSENERICGEFLNLHLLKQSSSSSGGSDDDSDDDLFAEEDDENIYTSYNDDDRVDSDGGDEQTADDDDREDENDDELYELSELSERSLDYNRL